MPIVEPTNFEPTRTIKASTSTSDGIDASQLQAHTPSPVEPQVIEKIQTSIAEPHLSDPAARVDPQNIEDVPERIGYLKEVCGLDFGWGPSSMVEWTLEHIHIWGGLSWTASAITLGLLIRAVMVPMMISSARETSKMREMQPIIKPLVEQAQAARAKGDSKKALELQREVQVIRKEFDFKIWKAFVPIVIQLPFGFGAWRVLRNAASLPVPGFVTESWLWTSDLSFSDPYFILPAMAGGLIFLTFKTNRKANRSADGVESSQTHFTNLMMKVLPFITVAFMSVQPGAVQLYIVASSSMALATAQAMTNSAFRRMVRLPELPAENSTSGSSSAERQEPVIKPTAGMNTRRHNIHPTIEATSRTVSEAPQLDSNRSVIDKVVDAGKDQWKGVKSNVAGMAESVWTGTKESTELKQKTERSRRYEAQYRKAFEEQRMALNEESKRQGPQPPPSSQSPGGMRRR